MENVFYSSSMSLIRELPFRNWQALIDVSAQISADGLIIQAARIAVYTISLVCDKTIMASNYIWSLSV